MVPDVLSEILDDLRLRSYVHSRNEFVAPWGLRIPDSIDEIPRHARPPGPPGKTNGAARDALPAGGFYFVTEGRCWFEIAGPSHEPVCVERGDLVIFVTHRGHRLRDSLTSPVRPVWEVVTPEHFHRRGTVRCGQGGGARTKLIAGGFYFEDRDEHRLLSALPPVIHLKRDAPGTAPWLAEMLRILTHETEAYEPGAQTVINHLAHALFAQAVRYHVARLPAGEQNWLAALFHPKVGPALGRIHANPEVRWTVESLAEHEAMSRSTFAATFTAVVGEPPLQYLTRYRMHRKIPARRDCLSRLRRERGSTHAMGKLPMPLCVHAHMGGSPMPLIKMPMQEGDQAT